MLEALDTSTDDASHHFKPTQIPQPSGLSDSFKINSHHKILHQIFHNLSIVELSKIARVCKTWKQVSDDDQQWKKFITASDQAFYPGGKWKGLFLHKRREFLALCSQTPGIYVRVDSDTFVASKQGSMTGEVVINVEKDDRLLAPVSLRFIGYEESYDNHIILADKVQDVEIGVYSEKHNWSRTAFPYDLVKGLHSLPFSMTIPKIDFTDGEPLPPSVDYVWDEDMMFGSETFAVEYLIIAKAQLQNMRSIKKRRPITLLPPWNPREKFSRVRFCNDETVYSSRFPAANVKFKAALHMHPNINDTLIDFEFLIEVENTGTDVSGPLTVSLFHTAASGDFVAPDLNAERTTKEYPMNIAKSFQGAPPYKRKIEFSAPQRDFWIEKIRGPPPAFAQCLHSIALSLKIGTFSSATVVLPIEFLKEGQQNTEKEQDLKRSVVQLE